MNVKVETSVSRRHRQVYGVLRFLKTQKVATNLMRKQRILVADFTQKI